MNLRVTLSAMVSFQLQNLPILISLSSDCYYLSASARHYMVLSLLSSLKTAETERYCILWLTCKIFLGFTQIQHHGFSLTSGMSMLQWHSSRGPWPNWQASRDAEVSHKASPKYDMYLACERVKLVSLPCWKRTEASSHSWDMMLEGGRGAHAPQCLSNAWLLLRGTCISKSAASTIPHNELWLFN